MNEQNFSQSNDLNLEDEQKTVAEYTSDVSSGNLLKKKNLKLWIISSIIVALIAATLGGFLISHHMQENRRQSAINAADSAFFILPWSAENITVFDRQKPQTEQEIIEYLQTQQADYATWSDLQYYKDEEGKFVFTHGVLTNSKYHDRVTVDCPSGTRSEAEFKYEKVK